MNIAITHGISVSVDTHFNFSQSTLKESLYLFNYHITIENKNNFPVQLKNREWLVYDSLDIPKIIKGEGVIGEQPTLQPGEVYSYTSSCNLISPIGYMQGHYTFINTNTNEDIIVMIPKFTLNYPGVLN